MLDRDTIARIGRIDRDGCLALLAGEVVGRLGVIDGGRPLIFPVNYVLDGTDIVFRTDQGTKLDAGLRSPVSFEVDQVDRVTSAGWSVLVTGRLEGVTPFDAATLERVRGLPVDSWADGPRRRWVRLVSDRFSGRRVGPAT